MLREFVELGRYRLDRGWSYRQLAEEINATCKARKSAFTISLGRIHALLTDPKLQPNDVTLHAIREFLKTHHGKQQVSA